MKVRILYVLIVLLAFGCREEKSVKRSGVASPKVKNVKILLQDTDNALVKYGDTLRVKLEYDAESPVQSVILRSQRNDIRFNQTDSLTFWLSTESLGGGYHGLRAEVMLADSTAMRGSSTIRVVLPEPPAEWGYRLIETYPHDSKAYTQGLLFHDGWLYESNGRYGMSDLRKVNLNSGETVVTKKLEDDYFAEGLALYNDELYQLTWQEHQVFVYDLSTLEKKRSFENRLGNGEGWGLCYDGERFIFSDGSADLTFIDPEDWSQIKQVRVFDHRGDVGQINELELVAGKLYANILNQNRIAVIDPETGAVQAYWNFDDILSKQPNVGRVDVMNGIAYRFDRSTFLVTGKLWPYLFEVAPVY